MKKAHHIHRISFALVFAVLFAMIFVVKASNDRVVVRQNTDNDYPSISEDLDGVITNNYVAITRTVPDENPNFDRAENHVPKMISPVVQEELVDNKIVDRSNPVK